MNAVVQPGLTLESLGDSAVLAVLGERIHPDLNTAALALADELDRQRLKGVVDIVPAYASVAVHYLPLRMEAPADQSRRNVESWIRRSGRICIGKHIANRNLARKTSGISASCQCRFATAASAARTSTT